MAKKRKHHTEIPQLKKKVGLSRKTKGRANRFFGGLFIVLGMFAAHAIWPKHFEAFFLKVSEVPGRAWQNTLSLFKEDSPQTPSQTSPSKEGAPKLYATTLQKNTPIFEEPSTKSGALGMLAEGESVKIWETKPGWARIEGKGLWVRQADIVFTSSVK